MKKDLKEIIDKFIDSDKPLQLRLFNVACVAGIVGAVFSLIISFLIDLPIIQNLIIATVICFMFFCFYIANWKGRLHQAAVSIIAILSVGFFPFLFFTGGGLSSGMSSWFALGIFITFVLIDGIAFFVLLIIQVSSIVICYVIGYYNPDLVTTFSSEFKVTVDVVQSLLVLGFFCGVTYRFQKLIYRRLINQVEEKNSQLKKAETMANSANVAKTDFLSNMSHEIRTPINAVLGMNEMILRECDDQKIRNYATEVQNSGKNLLSIINDVLDISKIESGKIEIVPNDYKLTDLISASYKMIAERSEKKKLNTVVVCDSSLPSILKGDEKRMRQVLSNLLTNAVKYTEAGSVEFRVDGIIKNNFVNFVFSIKDTGIGIKPEDQDKIFEKFVRTDLKKNRNIEGTGLGLCITKELIELMGGTIELKSEYGKGSEFIVRISQQIMDFSPIGTFDAKKTVKSKVRVYHQSFEAPEAEILAVDDVDINLIIFENLLKETKLKITLASSGQECLDLTAQKRYDTIFMDHMMPEMDGIQTLKKLRSMPDNPNYETPVVMLTANALTGVREEYLEAGFNDYISKPIDGRALEEMLLKYLPAKKVHRTGIITI